MGKKYSLTLDNEFIQYCKLNNIDDIEGKAKEVFTQGFTILKYGETPKIGVINRKERKIPDVPLESLEPLIEVSLPPTPKFLKDLYDE